MINTKTQSVYGGAHFIRQVYNRAGMERKGRRRDYLLVFVSFDGEGCCFSAAFQNSFQGLAAATSCGRKSLRRKRDGVG